MLFQSRKTFILPSIFLSPIESNKMTTFKVQRSSKDIVKIVNMTTVVQP